MLVHFINLILRSFLAIPTLLGSNWLGLIFPILIVILAEVLAGFVWGWGVVKDNWKKATRFGFAALGVLYALLLCWCVITTTYSDHMRLAARVRSLVTVVNQDASREAQAVDKLKQQLSESKQVCAELTGETTILDRLAKSQQDTINNCQTQALSLLTPPALSIKTVSYGVGGKPWNLLILFGITNKPINPIYVKLLCTGDIQLSGDGKNSRGATLGGEPVTMDSSTSLISSRSIKVHIGEPAWTPIHPLELGVLTDSENTTCEFVKE